VARVVGWDIECSGLKADFAFLLCAAFGVVGEKKIRLISLRQFLKGDENPLLHERELVKAVAEEYAKADVLVGHYSTGFDRPFLAAKMLEYGLPPLPNIPHIDTYYLSKKLAISRKSLQNVAYYSGIKQTKSAVEGRLWKAAQAGNIKALKAIEHHNVVDVQVLNEVYLKLRPLMLTHPRVNGFGPCRACGQDRLQSRGAAISSLKGHQRRYQCAGCGAWETRAA
jgi:uncharacterized protein YprB with RNaseH-like and TPR domain